MIVGMLGGIASGKSTVAHIFGDLRGVVIDADEIAGSVLQEEAVRKRVRDELGAEVLGPDGLVDRGAVSRIVFDDPSRLEALNGIIHPPVGRIIDARIQDLKGSDIAVLDIPLLLESPYADRPHLFVFVEATEERRTDRAQRNRGWSAGEVARREKRQALLDEKRERADLIIKNNGSIEELRDEVAGTWRRIEDKFVFRVRIDEGDLGIEKLRQEWAHRFDRFEGPTGDGASEHGMNEQTNESKEG
ncbi:MAG: dephospho-CoA kinase [Planctomycetota bacterium]|nr:dephospho-CoA kinase [Planctomycetota bacterium]